MEGELLKGSIHIRMGRYKSPTFPTNKFLLAAEVDGLDTKKSSGFVGTVEMDWEGRPENRGPVTRIRHSQECDAI